MLPTTMRMEADVYPSLPCFAHMIFGKHQRHIKVGRPHELWSVHGCRFPRTATSCRRFSLQIYILRNSMARRTFSTVLFLQLRSCELTWKWKTETNDSHAFQLKSTRHIDKPIHLLLHWHNIVGTPAGNASKGVIGSQYLQHLFLHHDSSMLLSLDVRVVQKVMWAGI